MSLQYTAPTHHTTARSTHRTTLRPCSAITLSGDCRAVAPFKAAMPKALQQHHEQQQHQAISPTAPQPQQQTANSDTGADLQQQHENSRTPAAFRQQELNIELLLYDDPHSEYCAKVKVALHHKGLIWQSIPVKPCGGQTVDAEFTRKVPLNKIPALVVRQKQEDGQHFEAVLYESEVINEWLEDQFPDPPLLPADPLLRAKARLISRFHDVYLEPALRKLYPLVSPAARDPAAVAAAAAGCMLRLQQLEQILLGTKHSLDRPLVKTSVALQGSALVPQPLLESANASKPLQDKDSSSATSSNLPCDLDSVPDSRLEPDLYAETAGSSADSIVELQGDQYTEGQAVGAGRKRDPESGLCYAVGGSLSLADCSYPALLLYAELIWPVLGLGEFTYEGVPTIRLWRDTLLLNESVSRVLNELRPAAIDWVESKLALE